MKVAVFDFSEENRSTIKQLFLRYSFERNRDFDVLWFTKNVKEELMMKYIPEIQLAYISLENQDGLAIGKSLYELNPDCLICYYKSSGTDLYPLLCTRPIDFFCDLKEKDIFLETHHRLIDCALRAKSSLKISTRKQVHCYNMRNILYLQSDLKYVDIVTLNGQTEHLFGKLSDLEAQLDSRFIRIHKSYIVNSDYITKLDKQNHTVALLNDVVLPISNAHYKNVLACFDNTNSSL